MFRSPPSSALLHAAPPQRTFARTALRSGASAAQQFTFVNLGLHLAIRIYICESGSYKCEFTFVNYVVGATIAKATII